MQQSIKTCSVCVPVYVCVFEVDDVQNQRWLLRCVESV